MNKTIQATSSASTIQKNGVEVTPYKIPSKKTQKSRKSRASFETSLPFISAYADDIKNFKSEAADEQIILMKARLHALRQMKQKIELKKQKSLQKIQFIHTVRERKNYESAQKLKEKQKQNRELEELKQKAKQLREGMKRQILKARQTIYMKNLDIAHSKKSMQEGLFSQIQKKQQQQKEQKQRKVQNIKQQQMKHAQILRGFKQSRIRESQKNHIYRIQKEIRQKQKKRRSLEKLMKQQQKMIDEVKIVEQQYEEIVSKINPQTDISSKSSRIMLIKSRNY